MARIEFENLMSVEEFEERGHTRREAHEEFRSLADVFVLVTGIILFLIVVLIIVWGFMG